MRVGLCAFALAWLSLGSAWAQPRASVRTGTEGDRGRVVFDWTDRVPYTATREGDQIRLRFGDGQIPDLSGGRRLPRNVVGMALEGDSVLLTLAPGARSRVYVLGNRVVIDATDAVAGTPAASAPAAQAAGQPQPQAQTAGPRPPAAAARTTAAAPAAAPSPAASPPAQAAGQPQPQPQIAGARSPAAAARPAAAAPTAAPPPAAPPSAQAPTQAPAAGAGAPAAAARPTPPASSAAAPARAAGRQPRRPGQTTEAAADAEAAALAAALNASARPGQAQQQPAPAPEPPPAAAPPPAVPVSAPEPAPATPPSAPPVNEGESQSAPAQATDATPAVAPAPPPPVAPVAAPAPAASAATPASAPPAPRRSATAPAQPPVARIVPGAAGPALLVTADAETGAAALRRGDVVLLAFDSTVAPDISALASDPLFGGTTVEAFPGGVLMTVPLAPPARLAARRNAQGWLFELERSGVDTPPARAIVSVIEEGPPPRIVLRAARPGRVVAITDPQSGAPLLIATLREAGQAVGLPRGVPEARLLPTMLGAAVLARSDHVVLRALPDRIVLQGSAQAPLQVDRATGNTPSEDLVALRRTMDLPAVERTALFERLRANQTTISEAPPLARTAARRDAAEALLALGLAQEAQTSAALALREDPRAREDARLLLVHGAASVAAQRPAEAGALDDARLADDEEAALWRALRRVAQGAPAEGGPAIARGLPLLLAYPEDLRARLLPLAADGVTEAGEWGAIRRLAETAPELPSVALARARLAEEDGAIEEALAQYGLLAVGPNRQARARALRRSLELRLARGLIDPAAAAAAQDALLYAWRGDSEEYQARMRTAELYRAAGAPRTAFVLLDETARMFPDQANTVRAAMADALGDAIATEPPLAAVTLHEAHGALLSGAMAERAARTLAERLVALDLVDQAARLLRDAMARATDPSARASLGARLAALHLAENEPAEALDALTASEARGLDSNLARDRTLLLARALAGRGDTERAAGMLDALGPAGAAVLADLRAGQQDWAGAAAAIGRLVDAELSEDNGPATVAQQRMIAQQAAWLAMAGDAAALTALRDRYADRMAQGPLTESFALLTADPMRGMADLPRLTREIEMLRALPTRLEALRNGVGVAR